MDSPTQFLDADAADVLSRLSPQKSDDALPSNELKENTQENLDLNLADCSSAENKPEDESILDNHDSNLTVKHSTEFQEKIDSFCENYFGNKDLNDSNCSGNTESLDKDATPNTESNVPIFCLTITEGSDAINEKGIETEIIMNNYREEKDSDSDDSSIASDSSSDCSDSFLQELRSSVNYVPGPKTYNVPPPEDYHDVNELIPIEDLDINVKESEVEKIGDIQGIVELEVVIKSIPGMKTLQLNSLLFLSNERPLGHVCDVYGPVRNPYYSVRFKTKEQMEKVGVEVGKEVFYAPERKEITKYILAEDLVRRYRASDASGRNDDEISDDNLDSSDDGMEMEAVIEREYESAWPESSRPNANPFYSMNQEGPGRRNTASRRKRKSNIGPPTWQQETPVNHPPSRNFIQCQPSPQTSTHPFHAPMSPYTPDRNFVPPSPLARLNFLPAPQASSFPPPPSPIPTLQYSLPLAQSPQRLPIGPPRPISLGRNRPRSFSQKVHTFGQMTPLGPMSQAPPRVSFPPTVSSPPPSTTFPPTASTNFSYFSHPFPSPQSNVPLFPPRPIQSMSPLSIQIPNSARSPPLIPTSYHNVQHQQNFGGVRPTPPLFVDNYQNYLHQQHQQNFRNLVSSPPVSFGGYRYVQRN